MITWIKQAPAACPGGDVGGDYQYTASFSVRWLAEHDPRRIVTMYFYGVADEGCTDYEVERQIEFRVLADPADPDSEVWSDTRYFTGFEGVHPCAEDAERAARLYAEGATADAIDWDGRLPWE